MRANLQIQQLMMEKIGGVINAIDEAYLDHLIETDSVVANLWHQTKKLYTAEDIDSGFNRFDQLTWQDITTLPVKDTGTAPAIPSDILFSQIQQEEVTVLNEPATAIRRIRLLIRAAAVLLPLLAIASWWFFRSAPASPQQLQLADKKHGVQLQLANGQVLNLSSDSGSIALQNVQLNNNNKTLSLATSTIDSSKGNEKLTLAVPVGLDYKVQLPDGSQVWLNSATTMHFSVPFNEKERNVFIDGEAFIQVVKDVNRPFFVHTKQSTVQVLGTSFNINSYDDNIIKVSLVEGAVKMQENGASVTLKPGQQAVATERGINVKPFDEAEELSWRQGIFYFSNTSLSDIARILPRWFGTPIIMDNPNIARETFTGSLERSLPITVFLENLKSTTTVDYYFDKAGQLHFK